MNPNFIKHVISVLGGAILWVGAVSAFGPSALPTLKQANTIPSPQGGVRYISTASIEELNGYYKTSLTEQGWSVHDQQTDGKSFGNATFIKAGEYLALTMGGNPAGKPPTVMVSLLPLGRISSADLPVYANADSLYTSPATSIYVSSDPVSLVGDKTYESLTEDGWSGSVTVSNETMQMMNLTKDGTSLQVMVQVAPAQGNKTSIQYGVSKAR